MAQSCADLLAVHSHVTYHNCCLAGLITPPVIALVHTMHLHSWSLATPALATTSALSPHWHW